MSANGRALGSSTSGPVLHWPKRVLAVADLRDSLNGQRELVLAPHTVVTPLAGEELRHRGIRVTRSTPELAGAGGPVWGYGQDRPHGLVRSAVQALARDGLRVRELPPAEGVLPCRWARAVAQCVAAGECAGGVVFCEDPGLVCCVANKVAGLRAVAVTTVGQAARATWTLAANLLAVEMPGRTFYEVRQILRLLSDGRSGCPDGVACTLRELDGHAHR
jgi:hypothetical protein